MLHLPTEAHLTFSLSLSFHHFLSPTSGLRPHTLVSPRYYAPSSVFASNSIAPPPLPACTHAKVAINSLQSAHSCRLLALPSKNPSRASMLSQSRRIRRRGSRRHASLHGELVAPPHHHVPAGFELVTLCSEPPRHFPPRDPTTGTVDVDTNAISLKSDRAFCRQIPRPR